MFILKNINLGNKLLEYVIDINGIIAGIYTNYMFFLKTRFVFFLLIFFIFNAG